MKLLKSIIISIVFWTTCLFASQTMVKDIAVLSANSLYNLDDEQIVASLKPYMQQHKQIKAIKITDNTDGSTFMALFYKNKKIIHNNKFDEKKLSFLHQSANITYDGEKIGIVDLYYIRTNQIVFSTKEQEFIKQQLPIKYVFDPKWKPFEFKNEINEHDGLIADFLQIIKEKSNLNLISVKTNSWKESKALIKSKQADMFSATKENEKRKKLWKEYFTLKDMYADVKYIFVSTIHKLQGSTYDVAYIDVASLIYLMNSPLTIDLAYRLLYVAVTRARKDIKILI